jgi:hypothetical protein
MPLELIILQSTLIFITRLYYTFTAFVHEHFRLKRAKKFAAQRGRRGFAAKGRRRLEAWGFPLLNLREQD